MTISAKVRNNLPWLPAYFWQRLRRRLGNVRPLHLVIAVADHFEPSILPDLPWDYAARDEQERRMEHWCLEYPTVAQEWRDSDGRPFRHTYFYPAEQYDKPLLERLAEHCQEGWGEIEIQLHHGVKAPDTAANTWRQLLGFRDALAGLGCLSVMDGSGPPRYAFVHGNWALANSAGGPCCGVDSEMRILAETGCYADFTLPSAPDISQIRKINSLYECGLPLDRRAAHRSGRDLELGRTPDVLPLIVQGPLMLDLGRAGRGRWVPRIENSELTGINPPTPYRLSLWRRAAITVKGRPDWLFIKLHCHGMDPRDSDVMMGPPMRRFLDGLFQGANGGREYQLYFTTAREMVNIILAACDARDGRPGDYRDYRLKLIRDLRRNYEERLCAESRES